MIVTFGDLVQQGVTQEDMSLTGAALAVGTFAFWTLVLSYTSFRFRPTRRTIDGVSLIVVRDGQPLEDVISIERLTVDEVLGAAREQGIADLRQVRLGILEPDGRMSFLRSDGARPPPDLRPPPGV